MRVLHIGLCSIMGGIESFALNYFAKLGEKGIVFDFADIYGAGIAGGEKIEALGGKVISLPNYKKHPLKTLRQLTKLLKQHTYDAVHINAQTAANILPALAAKRAGVQPAIHAHVVNEEGTLRKVLHKMNLKRLRRIPAVHLACSRETGQWLWGSDDFEVIPNAVDLRRYAYCADDRQRIRRQLSVDEDTVLLGYVGRLEPVKNPLFAVQVLAQYKQDNPDAKVKLLMLGDGSLYGQVQEKVKSHGLQEDVILAGLQSNVPQYLSAMDIFLMPSLHEALSLAAVEAQSNGLSCLFADTITEELKILETAVFLPLEDPEAWARRIEELSDKPNCSRMVATEAVEKAGFNIERSAELLLDVYRRLKAVNGRAV